MTSRRSFLVAASAAVSATRVAGANDEIRLGIIGVGSRVKIGGRGRAHINEFRKQPGVRIVALCDADRAHLEPELQKCRDRGENVEAYTDYRKLLDNKNVDAVIIATPNHSHAVIAIAACQAGKDAMVEKPASHNLFEGRKMMEAAEKYGRMVAVPHGPRESPGVGEAFAWARAGNLGKMLYVHGINYRARTSIGKVPGPQRLPSTLDYNLWSGPAPIKPLMREYLHYDWHWDWDYGNGDLGNMGIHRMDACRWAVAQDALPERVVAIGGRFGYDDDGQTPNTVVALLDYKPVPIIFEVRGLPKNRAFRDGNWEQNTKWSMDDYYGAQNGVVIHCENGLISGTQAFDTRGRPVKTFDEQPPSHARGFVEAIRTRKAEALLSDVKDGHYSAGLVHMINAAYRTGEATGTEQMRDLVRGDRGFANAFERFLDHVYANRIDVAKTPSISGALAFDTRHERFTGPLSDRANLLLTREYRAPFEVPQRV